MYLAARRDADALNLQLRGEWRAAHLGDIEAELQALDLNGLRSASITADQASLDLAAAWLLRDFLERAGAAGLQTHFTGPEPLTLALVERCVAGQIPAAASAIEWPDPTLAVEDLGRRAVRGLRNLAEGLSFIGRVCITFLQALLRPHRLRPIAIARHVYDTGITAVPIVSLIAFLISVILAYMGAQQLSRFGADVFVVDLVTVGVLRELGVLLTAIIIAGRSGSAFAAEIGAMELNEEVDALNAMGVDPIEVLVLPRLLGLVIALPLLTMVADIIGLVGGGLLCHELLDMPLLQYMSRVQGSIASSTFWVGIIKAPVFAALIAVAGCHCGLKVRGSSRELGRLTTLAVVQAIFFVILADALFAVLFLKLDL
jgi:phospholipid/cholesterol/gamma-HCH transport system permease protein